MKAITPGEAAGIIEIINQIIGNDDDGATRDTGKWNTYLLDCTYTNGSGLPVDGVMTVCGSGTADNCNATSCH